MIDAAALSATIRDRGPVTRIVIVAHQGSTPRETGTSMLVWPTGQQGTIGGGALELQAATAARAAKAPTVLKLPLGPALGQCCGGAVTLVIEPFSAPPTEPFARRITGTADQPLAITRALARYRAEGTPPPLIWQDGWLLEPIAAPEKTVWLYGAGHVGRAIVDTLADLPVAITWVDTSADRFPETVPASVTVLPAADPARAALAALDDAHHLILTYSHALDLALCHALLSRPAASIGLIGSATKWARFRARLTDLGHDAASIARIACPIGDPRLGKHPKAIALGVAVDLLQSARRDRTMKDTA